MSKMRIILMMLIIASIGVLIFASQDMATYSDFTKAKGEQSKSKVVGTLSKDKEMVYDPIKDPNYFSFYMKDQNGVESKVVLNAPKPQDFERSEQIVLTGQYMDDVFMANDMLLKCPSKYKGDEVYIKSTKS